MKLNQALPLLVLTIICSAGVPANSRAAEANREADHVALRQLRDKVSNAINNQDVNTIVSCFAKQYAFTTITQTVLTNETQIKSYYDQMFRAPGALLTSMKTEPIADILTRFLAENAGVCYGSSKETYTLKTGEVVTMSNRWSATVVKEDGQWKVALAHAGTDFLNNPVLSRVTVYARKTSIAFGLGGLVVGIVLGAVIARRKRSAA